MGKKTKKTSHQASRSLIKPSSNEKKEILDLYSKHKDKGKTPLDPLETYINSPMKKIEIGSIIEGLKSNDPEIIADSLKNLSKIAEENSEIMVSISPLVLNLLATHQDTEVRYSATKAVVHINVPEVTSLLVGIIENDRSEKVKAGAIKALGNMKANGYIGFIADILENVWDQSVRVRRAAAHSLGRLDEKLTTNILVNTLINDPDKAVRIEAAEAIALCLLKLEKNESNSIIHTISTQIDSAKELEYEVRLSVIQAITVTGSDECIPQLITALEEDSSDRVRGQAAHALAHYFDPRIEKALIASLDREKEGTKKRIALALAHYAMRNPLGLHDEICDALIYIQKIYPRGSYIWKEAVKALPAC